MVERKVKVVSTHVHPQSLSREFRVRVVETDSDKPGEIIEGPLLPFACEVDALKTRHGGSWQRFLDEHIKPLAIGRHEARHHNKEEAEGLVGKEL